MTEKTKIQEKLAKSKVKQANNKGPALYQRDDNGLLCNTQYEFNDDGSINWRAMIKEEHLFPNKSWFESRGKDCPRTIEGLADHQLLIKLAGIKELAKLRGFKDVSYETVKCDEGHVAVCCNITFIANYETGSEPVKFQDMANATLNNTSSFATKFLETIACNRAFVRCVRNFLNVHIVGDDEIDKSSPNSRPASKGGSAQTNPFSPSTTLRKKAESSLGCNSFEDFKGHIRNWWRDKVDGIYQNDSISNWTSWEDISEKDARMLIGIISNQ
jgi:hypothetical protein